MKTEEIIPNNTIILVRSDGGRNRDAVSTLDHGQRSRYTLCRDDQSTTNPFCGNNGTLMEFAKHRNVNRRYDQRVHIDLDSQQNIGGYGGRRWTECKKQGDGAKSAKSLQKETYRAPHFEADSKSQTKKKKKMYIPFRGSQTPHRGDSPPTACESKQCGSVFNRICTVGIWTEGRNYSHYASPSTHHRETEKQQRRVRAHVFLQKTTKLGEIEENQ